jgi:hypothetical protein
VSSEPQQRKSYPVIPAKPWWAIRRRFQQSMPGRVDPGYLQTVLSVQEGHAQNLIGPLKAVGLIDGGGKPTDLANEWRTDDGYAKACETIIKSIYPSALTDAVPPSSPDRDAAKGWFARELRVGEGAASKMASFYLLLADGDPIGEAKAAERSTATRTTTPRARKPVVGTPAREREQREPDPPPRVDPPRSPDPSLHIDIQVHIPSDASPEQIDSIFASMAKHLYRRS